MSYESRGLEIVVCLVMVVLVLSVDRGELDIYRIRWDESSPHASKLTGVNMGICLGVAYFLHSLGARASSEVLFYLLVVIACGVRDVTLLVTLGVYMLTAQTILWGHTFVIHRGVNMINARGLLLLGHTMRALGIFVPFARGVLVGDTNSMFNVVWTAVYLGATAVADWYFYFLYVPREYQAVALAKKDGASRTSVVNQYNYLLANDPGAVSRWGGVPLGVVWRVGLGVTHLAH
jgi:hypothetical protein